MAISIRELGLNDSATLQTLVAVWGGGESALALRGGSGPVAFVADTHAFVVGGFVDGRAAGWAWGAHVREPAGSLTSIVRDLRVIENQRRQGLGTALFDACFGVAQRRGSSRLELAVHSDDPTVEEFLASVAALAPQRHDAIHSWRV